MAPNNASLLRNVNVANLGEGTLVQKPTPSKISISVIDSYLLVYQEIFIPRPELRIPTASLPLTHTSLNGFHEEMHKILLR